MTKRKQKYDSERIRAQYSREDKQRWDRDIREACARFLIECVKLQEELLPDGPRPERLSAELGPTPTSASIYQSYYELTLIAPKAIRHCAYNLMVATNAIANFGISQPKTSDKASDLSHSYHDFRRKFANEVRQTLGHEEIQTN